MTSANRQKKEIKVAEITKNFESATAIVLVNYTGLTVKKQQELKKMLKAINASMFVAKNNLMQIAGNNAKLPSAAFTDEVLAGPTALVITKEDPIAPLQVLAKFAKENEIPQFKVGIIEGTFYDKSELITLASLPSKEILFGQVVGAIAAPIYGLVNTMQANLQKLLYILDTKAKQKA
ncbi:MAG: 50S ribosomal protein L10 [Patescibacteria group bacterium]|nr:50S ribosomal protein L10 [Patescibacteria group bacterium]